MEWLLILSAMLSAVTGAFTGAGAPEAQLHQPEAASVASLAVEVAQEAALQPPPAVEAIVPATAEPAFRPAVAALVAAPLEAVRLIE